MNSAMKNLPKVFPAIIICIASLLKPAQAEQPASNNETSVHHSKQGYHHSFDDVEKWVKKFDDPARDKWQKPDEVIKALKIGATDKVADIGAGTGYFSLRIARAYPSATVYAADVEPSMIDYLNKQSSKENLSNHVAVKIPTDKPDLPGKVNLVLVVDTYHHIDDRTSYFETLRKKQLLPNAKVVIIDFTAESPEGPPAEHRMSKADVQAEMQSAGYALDQDIQMLPYQYFLIFKPAKD